MTKINRIHPTDSNNKEYNRNYTTKTAIVTQTNYYQELLLKNTKIIIAMQTGLLIDQLIKGQGETKKKIVIMIIEQINTQFGHGKRK